MFARLAFLTCLALLFLGPAANSEEASHSTENGSAADAAVSNIDSMAEHELDIGRYYTSQGNHPAAINRFKVVVTRFSSSLVVDEALFRLVQAYLAIGVYKEAQTVAGVLNRKFSQSHWRSDALVILQKAGLQPVDEEASWIIQAIH
jgi:outer membrane protein assembly factor BamD (BamD/ComL family)